MTDGERAIWAAAFVRRLLDTAKPTDSACATVASYQKWQHDTTGAAAQAATDVLGYARRALRSLLAHGLGPGTTTFDETCEMLGVRCCAERRRGLVALVSISSCGVSRHNVSSYS